MEKDTLNEVCRACSTTKAQLFISVFNPVTILTEDITYLECFHRCTLLDNSPSMPETLCFDCSRKLEAAYLFIKKCKETDLALRVGQQNIKESTSEFEWIEIEHSTEPDPNYDLALTMYVKEEMSKENNSEFERIEEEKHEPLSQENLEPEKLKKQKRAPRTKKDIASQMNTVNSAKTEKNVKISKETKSGEPPVETEEMTTCKICQKWYRKRSIATHISTVHRSRSFLCDACPKSFKNNAALRRHKITHQPNRPNFSCEICERKFLTEGILRAHMKTHDKNRKPKFACDQCDKVFFYSSTRNVHKKIHTGDTVQCLVCQKTLLRPVDLKLHMRKHTGDKPYKCDRCEMSYSRVWQLNQHILRHEGYSYRCDECGKKYVDQGSLIAHAKTHRGEEPYKCAVCDKVFGQKYRIRSHIQTKHGIHIPEEIDCQIIKIVQPKTCRKRIPRYKDGKYVYHF